MVQAHQLSYAVRDKKLLDQVSFHVESGQHLSILGANGAGKSTLLKLLCKDLLASDGSVKIAGKDIADYNLKELSTFRSVLSQHNALALSFTVYEIVLMGRYPHFERQPSANDVSIIKAVMEETGITDFSGRYYHTLSGGEQQRVQLARVIAQIYDQPNALLLLDEPTNGLDLLYQQQILLLARSLADRGFCVISILHDINFASRYADRILLLKQGKTVAFGTPAEVITCAHIYEAFQVEVTLMEGASFEHPLIMPSGILN